MKRFALILLIGFNVSGCYTENKARQQFSKAVVAYPQLPLDYCADQFPDKPDSVIVKTDTLTEILFMDSLVFNTDTLYRDSLGFKYRTVTKVVTKTIRKDSIIYRENKAEQQRLNLMLIDCQKNNNVLLAKLDAVEKDRDEWKGKARKKGWMFWGLIFLIIGAVGTRLYLKSKSIIK